MAVQVLQLGVKYDVKPLVQKCVQLIILLMSEDIQLKHAIETFTIARRYSLENLMDQAGDLLAWENVTKRIQYSDVRRLQPLALQLYHPVPKVLASYHQSYEVLEYCQNHEDNLEILYSLQRSAGATHSKVMVESLILEGVNYDSLQEYWPSYTDPEPEIQVLVSIEKLDCYDEGTRIFDRNCFIRKGEQTKLKVSPQIELACDVEYRFKVKFQGSVLVIKQTGQRDVDWNYDLLTNLKLATEVSDPNLAGILQVTIIKPLSENNAYRCGNYSGARALHVLKGLMLVQEC